MELDLEILLDVAVGQKALLLIAVQALVLLDDTGGLQLLGLERLGTLNQENLYCNIIELL